MVDLIFKDKAVVDIDNNFEILGIGVFTIPKENEEYKVLKKHGEIEEYENESRMDSIVVELGVDLHFRFYNEQGDRVFGVESKK